MYPENPDPAKQRRDDMILGLIVVNVLLSIVLGAMVYTRIINKPDDGSKKSSSSQSSDSDSGDFEASGDQNQIPATDEEKQLVQNQIASRNVQRKDDASRALAAGEEFAANNTGTLPTEFHDGALLGTDPNAYPSSVDLQYYTIMAVHFGKQEKVEADTLVLVTGATCADDGSTTDVSATPRSMAVMYGEETSRGTFKGLCIDN
jgi:hypothetical protein